MRHFAIPSRTASSSIVRPFLCFNIARGVYLVTASAYYDVNGKVRCNIHAAYIKSNNFSFRTSAPSSLAHFTRWSTLQQMLRTQVDRRSRMDPWIISRTVLVMLSAPNQILLTPGNASHAKLHHGFFCNHYATRTLFTALSLMTSCHAILL